MSVSHGACVFEQYVDINVRPQLLDCVAYERNNQAVMGVVSAKAYVPVSRACRSELLAWRSGHYEEEGSRRQRVEDGS